MSCFQSAVVTLPTVYPNAVVWSEENLVAVACGGAVIILVKFCSFPRRCFLCCCIIYLPISQLVNSWLMFRIHIILKFEVWLPFHPASAFPLGRLMLMAEVRWVIKLSLIMLIDIGNVLVCSGLSFTFPFSLVCCWFHHRCGFAEWMLTSVSFIAGNSSLC